MTRATIPIPRITRPAPRHEWSSLLALLMLSGLIVLSSCGESTLVTVPTSDPTPPTVELDIYGLPALTPLPTPTGTPGSPPAPPPLVLTSACCDTTRSIDRGTILTFFGRGTDDDGGVAYVGVSVGLTVTCGSGSVGITKQGTLMQEYTKAASPGDQVPPSALVQLNVSVLDLARTNCSPPNSLTGVTGIANATAKNFSGGTSGTTITKSLTFTY